MDNGRPHHEEREELIAQDYVIELMKSCTNYMWS